MASSDLDSTNVTWFPSEPETYKPAPTGKWLTTTAPATFDKVALVSASLGIFIGIGFQILPRFPGLGVYLISVGSFHLSEFWITAKYNSKSLGMWSFLLTNGVGYAGAHVLSCLEVLYKYMKYGTLPNTSRAYMAWFFIGATVAICGQVLRAAAMIKAGKSFHHYVQKEKHEDHKLVTTGLYAVVRHPSYTGFYFWSLGLQIMLKNWVSVFFYSIVLFIFFKNRLIVEEKALVEFFGNDYKQYKNKVWSGIPLIK